MPVSYRIHTGLGLVVTRYVGVVTADEFVEMFQSVLSDPEFKHGFNALVDFQELKDFKVTGDDLKRASRLMSSFYEGRSESMVTAAIAPRDNLYGMVRVYSAYADSGSEKVNVFRDVDEAMRSLGLEPVTLAELHGETGGEIDAPPSHDASSDLLCC